MRCGSIPRRGRVSLRSELPLLELSRRDGGRVQAGLLVWGDDDSNHTRCAQCGSLLYSVVRDGAYVHVALGSLADAPTLRPTEHIFVGSKAPWFELTDDLPRHEELG